MTAYGQKQCNAKIVFRKEKAIKDDLESEDREDKYNCGSDASGDHDGLGVVHHADQGESDRLAQREHRQQQEVQWEAPATEILRLTRRCVETNKTIADILESLETLLGGF